MSWEYNKGRTWYKFSDKVQKIIDEKYKNEYGYVDFIDDINFSGDNLTIIFDYVNNNHELQTVYNEELKVRRI